MCGAAAHALGLHPSKRSTAIHQRGNIASDDVYLRFLEAFALHQRGQLNQAAHRLIPLPRYRWHQGEAAVIASIIAATGTLDKTSGLLTQIDVTSLFEEERILVAPWQQQLSTSDLLVSKIEPPAIDTSK
jgi:hypothetical protein